MSSAALARKRRANMPTASNEVPQNGMSPSPPSQQRVNMTIPQVLSVFEKRIMEIEKRINETTTQTNEVKTEETTVSTDEVKQMFDEYEERFEMLLTQINQIKEMMSNLQMYTMTVNKTLLDRSGILSDEELNGLPSPGNMILPETQVEDINMTSIVEEDSESDEANKENVGPDLG
jgi:hypothetical protein